MKKFLGTFSPQLYALLRIVAGFMFLCHGLQKMFGVLGGQQPPMWSQFWIGGLIELVAGAMIMIGFQASWAAFIASGTMAVAYFQVHQPQGALPVQNKGELAALYAFVFLYMAAKGSGTWSFDSLLGRKRAD